MSLPAYPEPCVFWSENLPLVQLTKPDIPPMQNTLNLLYTLSLLNNLELDSKM
jgi:hypothetical protein